MVAVSVIGVAFCVVLATIWLLNVAVKSMKLKRVIDKIPGPDALPLVGNTHQLRGDGADFFAKVFSFAKQFHDGRMCRMWLGMDPYILLYGANTVDCLLNSTKHMDKAYSYTFLHPWLGTGLLTSTGEKWKVRRRMITPTFHFKILHDFLNVFNEQAEIMSRKLEQLANKGPFNIFSIITLCALDIICETAMGRNINAQANSDSKYVQAVYSIGEIIQNRQKNPLQWPDAVFNLIGAGKEHARCLAILHGFSNKVIQEKMAELKDKHNEHKTLKDLTNNLTMDSDEVSMGIKKKRLAFLDMLLCEGEDGSHLSKEDVREEVDTFMFEGHDTTAAAANWAVHLLGSHPEVQWKAQEELDRIFGDSERPASMEDLKEMKYLECVIKEALRLYPSVPFFGRTLTEDVTIGGYEIPKGSTALIVTYALHRDEKYFPDPERFDPDRFSAENVAGRHPFAYIPFSAGLRNCIGQKFALMEEKVILSTILRKFMIKSTQKEEELKPVGELILRPANGVCVELTSRGH